MKDQFVIVCPITIKPLPQKDFDDIYLYPADYSSAKKRKQKDNNQNGSSEEQKSDIRNEVSVNKKEKRLICDMPTTVLSFLEEEERECVINELENIQVKPNAKIHPVLIEYKKSIEEWKKHEKENTYIRRGHYDYYMYFLFSQGAPPASWARGPRAPR